jgi:alkylation response protein AidB-like acyl-CoA dehydrogenase
VAHGAEPVDVVAFALDAGRGAARAFDDLAGFLAALPAIARPVDAAAVGGALADRVGYAFAAGYRAALAALVPGEAGRGAACLCATEEGGAHPRAIATRLERAGAGWTVTGVKQWSTLAGAAEALLVVASAGVGADGKNQLKLVRVPAGAAGLALEAMPPPPFTPEIPHFRVRLDGVRVDDAAVLPGDGYDVYLKPFRTIEDVHVHAALVAHMIAMARRHGGDDAAPLAGLIATTHTLVAELDASVAAALPDDVRARWQRDRALLGVAGKARAARREAAWLRLRAG